MGGISQYQDFEISVTSDSSAFFASVLRSPAGECPPVRITLPFDPIYAADKVELALLRSIRPLRGGNRLEADLRAIGEGVFKALLIEPPEIQRLYSNSRARLSDDSRLRLKLRVDSEALSRLPFEFIYDPLVVRDYLGLHAQTSLVRYMSLDRPVPCLSVSGPLRILAMVANPKSSQYPELKVQNERARIDNAVKALHQKGEIEFEWVRGETYNDLFEALNRQDWHVFHFIGHGDVGHEGDDEGYVVFTAEAGGAHKISGSELKRLLALKSSLRLVVLNCCNSGGGSLSVAKNLVIGGMPAVLAMQYPITDDAAIELASGFYVALTNGEPVDGAVTAARIRMQPKSRLEWGTPILYMRSSDGQIFAKKPRELAPAAVAPLAAVPAPLALVPGPAAAALDDEGFDALEDRVNQRAASAADILFGNSAFSDLTIEMLNAVVEQGERERKAKPDHPSLATRLAAAHFELAKRYRKNNVNKAFVNLAAAVQLAPREHEYLYMRANIYAQNEQYDLARADIDRALEVAPQLGELHWARGLICLLEARGGVREEHLEATVGCFDRAIACDPNVAKYFSSRGAAFHQLGRTDMARQDLDHAISLDPKDGKTWFNRGHVRLAQRDRAGALEDFRTAVSLGYALAARELQRLETPAEPRT